jgi:hypothetical protein
VSLLRRLASKNQWLSRRAQAACLKLIQARARKDAAVVVFTARRLLLAADLPQVRRRSIELHAIYASMHRLPKPTRDGAQLRGSSRQPVPSRVGAAADRVLAGERLDHFDQAVQADQRIELVAVGAAWLRTASLLG